MAMSRKTIKISSIFFLRQRISYRIDSYVRQQCIIGMVKKFLSPEKGNVIYSVFFSDSKIFSCEVSSCGGETSLGFSPSINPSSSAASFFWLLAFGFSFTDFGALG